MWGVKDIVVWMDVICFKMLMFWILLWGVKFVFLGGVWWLGKVWWFNNECVYWCSCCGECDEIWFEWE